MLLARNTWQSILLFIAGVIFALHPEFGIVALILTFVLIFIEQLLRKQSNVCFSNNTKNLFFAVGILSLLRISLGFQTTFLAQGLLEGFSAFTLVVLAFYLQKYGYRQFGYGLAFGVVILVSIILYPRLNSFVDQNLYWQDDSTHAIRIQYTEVSKFRAIRKDSSWVVHNFSARGPGVIEYQFEIRADRAFQIGVFAIHTGLTGGRYDQLCEVKVQWERCTLKVNLTKRDWITVGVGGSMWNQESPMLEIKNARIIDTVPPNLTDMLTNPSRVKGFAFNENAFGVHVALTGLLIVIFLPVPWSLIAGIPIIASILLSGSRGALLAFLIGNVVWLTIKSRWFRLLPWFLMISLLGVVGLQFRALSEIQPAAVQSMRSLSLDNNSARGRLEIWRLATKSWLENPRTFLIGAGDLSSAMKVKFDTRSSGFGLTKDSLTHAHNLWIQTAGESGLLGLCAMLWLWGWVILRAWRSRDPGALALLAAIFVINSVDYLFFYAPVHLAFWMAAAGLKPRLESKLLKPEKSVFLT